MREFRRGRKSSKAKASARALMALPLAVSAGAAAAVVQSASQAAPAGACNYTNQARFNGPQYSAYYYTGAAAGTTNNCGGNAWVYDTETPSPMNCRGYWYNTGTSQWTPESIGIKTCYQYQNWLTNSNNSFGTSIIAAGANFNMGYLYYK